MDFHRIIHWIFIGSWLIGARSARAGAVLRAPGYSRGAVSLDAHRNLLDFPRSFFDFHWIFLDASGCFLDFIWLSSICSDFLVFSSIFFGLSWMFIGFSLDYTLDFHWELADQRVRALRCARRDIAGDITGYSRGFYTRQGERPRGLTRRDTAGDIAGISIPDSGDGNEDWLAGT